jgi:hypothetical protein
VQSVPYVQALKSEPGPPSSQSTSEAKLHVSEQRTGDGGGNGGEGEGAPKGGYGGLGGGDGG